jgi:hypothetical protein
MFIEQGRWFITMLDNKAHRGNAPRRPLKVSRDMLAVSPSKVSPLSSIPFGVLLIENRGNHLGVDDIESRPAGARNSDPPFAGGSEPIGSGWWGREDRVLGRIQLVRSVIGPHTTGITEDLQ